MNRWSIVLATVGVGGIVIGFAALTVRATRSAPVAAPVVAPVVAPRPAPEPSPAPVPDPDDAADGPDVSGIVRDACDLSLVPPALRQQVSDAETDALVEQLRAWAGASESWNGAPRIEYRRGIVYVESEEDRGDDPPYPRSANAEAERVCGSASVWLRSALHEELASHASADAGGLRCQGNVCCYDGMEYAPTGVVVFHYDEDIGWSLAAWAETHEAALAEEIATANNAFVAKALRRLAETSCPHEPAGAY